jgi:Fe-S-cluster containining protein
MNIREFSLNLQKVYNEMSKAFIEYQLSTGLHCLSGCGRCCLNPEIEASVLEMFPLALRIYEEGKAEEWLDKLENNTQESCLLFQSFGEGQGFCGSYNERPAICRMFGVGATDKHQKVRHSICKYIKETADNLPEANEKTPLISEWNTKLGNLNPELIRERKPINLAIKEAILKVALYAQYQDL